MSSDKLSNVPLPNADAQNFFEHSLSGFLITDVNGAIIKSNTRFAAWAGLPVTQLVSKRFSDLLSIGSKIYYETHLSPLLRMQGFFDEVLVELQDNNGVKSKVLINALQYIDKDGNRQAVHYTITKAADRILYEENLQQAKKVIEGELQSEKANVLLREQFIAILGHDLRNPLGAMLIATELLQSSDGMGMSTQLLATLKRSGYRMRELINNIMDFARTRLGTGITLNRRVTALGPVIAQVITESQLVFPKGEIVSELDIDEAVNCDGDRVAQLLSNLLANALTHGSADTPVLIKAKTENGTLNLSVCNSGERISEEMQQRLFSPFTKEESRPSQNGLGLGLYISSEIARAHGGTLSCTSTDEETCFTLVIGD